MRRAGVETGVISGEEGTGGGRRRELGLRCCLLVVVLPTTFEGACYDNRFLSSLPSRKLFGPCKPVVRGTNPDRQSSM